MTAAAVFALASIQFGYFYANYFPSYRAPSTSEEYEARVAFEAAIARARDRVVPAVYLGRLGPFGEQRWTFYTLKHDRSDLLPRTLVDAEFEPDRMQQLPPGSIAILGRSAELTKTIDRLVAGGQWKADVATPPDGASLFCVLERGGS